MNKIDNKEFEETFSLKKEKFDLVKFIKQKITRRKKFKKHTVSILTKKFITFCTFIVVIISLFLKGVLSTERVTYTEEQLAVSKEFDNDSGKITMLSQTYSEKNGIILVEFETSDQTSKIDKGISASNLEWQLSTLSNNTEMVMEVVPLTNRKIDVIIKNVPKDYDLLSIRIKNNTASDEDVDVDIQKYQDYVEEQNSKTAKSNKEDTEKSNETYFLVTPQSSLFKESYIKNLSREKFTLKIFNNELKFQKSQIKKLENSIEVLNTSIENDNKSISEIEIEEQYLTGDDLVEKQNDIQTLQNSIDSKNDKINKATDNINTVNSYIEQLERNIKAVKDGTYQFSSSITSISMKNDELE